jgi:hypothetical protein
MLLVVLGQDVLTEEARGIVPQRVDVIRVLIGGVVFDDERGSLHLVVMRLSGLEASHPREAPFRCRGMKCQLRRSLSSKANVILFSCSGVSEARSATAAAAISAAGFGSSAAELGRSAAAPEKTMTKSSKEGAIIFRFDLIDAPFSAGGSY